jgi:hypothetical protein
MVRSSDASHRLLDTRQASLLHLYAAIRTDKLLEQLADLPLGTRLAPDLSAGRALPERRLEKAADLPSALEAKATDHLDHLLQLDIHHERTIKAPIGIPMRLCGA